MTRLTQAALLALCSSALIVSCGGGSSSPGGSPPVVTQPGGNGNAGGGSGTPNNGGDTGGGTPATPQTRTFTIAPDNDSDRPAGTAQTEALTAFFAAITGDTIEFEEGTFNFDTTLTMSHKEGITVKGAGLKKTILNFEYSSTPEGFNMSHMEGILIEDLTVYDTPGFSIKISDSDHVTLRNMRTMWSSADNMMDPNVPSTLDVSCDGTAAAANGYTVNRPSDASQPPAFPLASGSYVDANGLTRTYVVDNTNGGYAIYPVLSQNVLLDNVIAIGASDAGIYVGQSNNIQVKNSEALFNVAGYEIENSDNADVFDSVAHCNTAGFLVFDLPGLSQYGDGTRIFNNYAGYNNQDNFAPGGIVSIVPRGIGLLQLGYDRVEFFGNIVEFNSTLGFVSASHELLEGEEDHPDKRMDLYPEGIHIHDNTFTTNGTSPEPPAASAFICQEGTGPGFEPGTFDVAPCIPTGVDDSDPSLLPALVQIKSAQAGDAYVGMGAHIIWDGMFDDDAYDCELDQTADGGKDFTGIVDNSTDDDGEPVGKPDYGSSDFPKCRYNKYKFVEGSTTERRHPLYWQCYPDGADEGANTFSPDSRKFLNFKDTDPATAPSIDIDEHDCPTLFGVQLQPLPAAVVEPYVPAAGGTAPPTEEEILEVCENFSGNTPNYAALEFNCPKLSHYNLFASSTEPRSGFNGNGILYDLITPLFSDYSSKYRVLFLPPGGRGQWVEGNESAPNATIDFPPGTVIAKSFAFKDGANEEIIETRLIIFRTRTEEDGTTETFWEGFSYIWETDNSGNRIDADIAIAGGTASVTWNYDDPDPAVGKTYTGSTDSYSVPHPNQCGSCHTNDDRQPGDAPIGPKIRNMNRPIDLGTGPVNQLKNLCDSGRLTGCPTDLGVNDAFIAENVPRIPRFDVAGDSFNVPDAQNNNTDDATKHNTEMRARAWLETNCAHCHNRKGLAGSTGVFFDVFKDVDLNYGVCKTPNTAGSSSGGRSKDIIPGNAEGSILSFRVHSEDLSIQMPPVARSLNHDEAIALIDSWIDDVLDADYDDGDCFGE